jgi:hypothetical protein
MMACTPHTTQTAIMPSAKYANGLVFVKTLPPIQSTEPKNNLSSSIFTTDLPIKLGQSPRQECNQQASAEHQNE